MKTENIFQYWKYIIIILLGLNSCHKPNRVFIVAPDIDHWMQDKDGNYIESSMRFNHYGNKNIIIDSTGNFFYYSKEFSMAWNCVEEEKKPISPPNFINLKPLDIIALDEENIEDFVASNLINENSEMNIVVFASARDTFTSSTLNRVISELHKQQANNMIYMIRRITEEEHIVLEYRKSGTDYNKNLVDWDTTKVNINF